METPNLRPNLDRVLVLQDAEADTTANGFDRPEDLRELPLRGTVVAVGPGKPGEPMTAKVGDRVHFPKRAGGKIEAGGKEYIIMREHEIWAFFND